MRFVVSCLVFVWCCAHAAAEDIQIGLSNDAIAIASNFDGDNVVVFGTIENGIENDLTNARYDVVVVVAGPDEDLVVRRKERRLGVWINGKSVPYAKVPSFYSMASNRALDEVAPADILSGLALGFDYLKLETTAEVASAGERETFRVALNRLMEKRDLSLKQAGGVQFLSPTLFRARLKVPANVPIGRHTARVYLFKDNKLLAKKSARIAVRKIGFEQYTYDLAHKQGLLYGIIAVLIAIATGWLASVVFRKD